MAIPLATITNNFLKCGVCLDTFRDPRSLPCQHAFCLQCLESCAASRRDKRSLVCPTCRKKAMVSQDKIKDLPVHFLARSLKDTVDMEKKGSTPSHDTICSNCSTPGNKAKVRCMDCMEYFCDECLAYHSKLKAISQSHRIVSIEDIISGKVNLAAEDAEKCKKHDKPYGYYCKNEKKLICQDCVILKDCPTKHYRITIDEAAKKQKRELDGLLTKSADTLKQYQEAVKATETTEKELETHCHAAKASLGQAEQQYVNLVKETVKRFEAEIDQIKEARKEDIEKKKNELKSVVDKIQKAKQDASKVIAGGFKFEVIAMHGTLSELKKLSLPKPTAVEKKLAFIGFEAAIPGIPSIGKVVKDGSAEEKWKLNGQFSTGGFNKLHGLAITQDGDIVIASSEKGVKVFSRSGQVKVTLYDSPGALDTGITTDNIFLSVPMNVAGIKFSNNDGTRLHVPTVPIKNVHNESANVNSLAVDPSGKIVVAQVMNTISIHNADGSPISKFATQSRPFRLAVTSNREIVGSFYDSKCERGKSVQLMDYSGNNLRVIQPPPEVTAWQPGFVCCGQGEIFVSNEGRGKPHGVYRFTSEGDYLGCVTTEISNPMGTALSRDGMELFVANLGENHVKIFKRP